MPSTFRIIDSTEAGPSGESIPVIAEVQEKVDGEKINWGENDNGEVFFSLGRHAGDLEAQQREKESNPNHTKTLSQLEQVLERIKQIGEMIKTGEYSSLSPEAQKYLTRYVAENPAIPYFVETGGLPLDIHRGSNLMIDNNGNVRIVDW